MGLHKIRETLNWCNDGIEHTKHLQDVCLDNMSDETIELIKRLSAVQEEIAELSKECESILL